ncbi:helix-turn-helix domain-containing protein [Pigmentiphaga litoralis]|uniref:helix-turn-helix domain-containing protein n=1 Tax=Pigmentiphaga litoralis TaxID=516702 RepID=UPI003B42B5FA
MSDAIGPVVRALDVLCAMNHEPQSTLLSLHHATGLPKSTLHRLLATLRREGYVRLDVVRGRYTLTAKVRELSEGYSEQEGVVDIAAPVLRSITRSTGLPLAIGVLDHGRIVVRYSSMPYSPIGSEHSTIGHAHDLLRSGMGQAFLGWCSETQRNRLMQRLLLDASDIDGDALLEVQLREAMAATRARGYGFRPADGRGASATLALPVLTDGEVVAVLSLTTFGALLVHDGLKECLAVLERCREEVMQRLAPQGDAAVDPACSVPRNADP